MSGIPSRATLIAALHGLRIYTVAHGPYISVDVERVADEIIIRLTELDAGPGPPYQAAALVLRDLMRRNVEESDGGWPGGDTVAELCRWMIEQGVDPEQDAP